MPVRISMTLYGVKDAQAKLNSAEGTAWRVEGMEKAAYLVQNRMAEYPEARTFRRVTRRSSLYSKGAKKVAGDKGRYWASSYRRTGTLGRSWTTRVTQNLGGDVEGRVGTRVKYAPWVQSARFQAWMHQGRWQTDEEVLARSSDEIRKYLQQALAKALKEG